jgi:hypothetical protein
MPIAIVIIILFLFQMAILAKSINVSLLEDDRSGAWKTDVRITINSEAEATPM